MAQSSMRDGTGRLCGNSRACSRAIAELWTFRVGCGSTTEARRNGRETSGARKLLTLSSLFIFHMTRYPGMENNLPQTMIVISLAKTRRNIGIFPCICQEVLLQLEVPRKLPESNSAFPTRTTPAGEQV